MPRPQLRTARLELRPLTADDGDLLVELDGDPDVMEFLSGRTTAAQEVIEVWMPRRTQPEHDALGLGYWSGFEKGVFVGWFCLTPTEESGAELGYRLRRRAWGRGLASEGAARLMEHGFDTVGLERIWAETMAANVRSRAVLERLGLRHIRTDIRQWDEPLPGAELGEVVYELTADEFAARRASPDRPVRGTGSP
jgi:RimJ/RimL family protein N-acetyltransferase